MSVTCQDLLTLKYFERIKLVAGPNGLDRTVTWPYVGQTSLSRNGYTAASCCLLPALCTAPINLRISF